MAGRQTQRAERLQQGTHAARRRPPPRHPGPAGAAASPSDQTAASPGSQQALRKDPKALGLLSTCLPPTPLTNLALGALLGSAEEISDKVQDGEGETWGRGKGLWAHAMSFKKDSNYQLNMGVKNPHLDGNRTDMT